MALAPPDEQAAVRSVAGLVAVTVSVAIAPFLVGALAPRIAGEITLSTRDVGVAMAGYYLLSGALSPAGGRVVDALGTTAALRWACALSTVGLVGIAASQNTVTIVVILALLGILNSVVQPSCNELLAELRHPRVRATSFGVLQASIPAATLIAALVLGLAGPGGGWRWTVVAVAGLTLLTQLVVPKVPRAPARHPSPDAGPGPDLPTGHGGPWFLAALVSMGFFASCAVTTLPSFAATSGHHVGLTAWTIAIAQTVGSAGSAVMRIVAATVTSHAGMAGRLTVIAGLQLIGILGFLGLASGTTAGFVVGTVAAFTFGWGFNGLFNMVVAAARPGQIARTTGLTQAGVYLGGMTGPIVFAAIAGADHFRLGWLAMSLFMAAASATTLLALRSSSTRQRPGAAITMPELDAFPTTISSTCTEGRPS